jgi:hypothetical protein
MREMLLVPIRELGKACWIAKPNDKKLVNTRKKKKGARVPLKKTRKVDHRMSEKGQRTNTESDLYKYA